MVTNVKTQDKSDDITILLEAAQNGIIDLSMIQEQLEMAKRKKYLAAHDHEIWQGKDGAYYTYLRDENGRKMHRRTDLEKLKEDIIEFYRERETNPGIIPYFKQWNDSRLDNNEIQPNSHYKYKKDFERFFLPTDKICKKGMCDIIESDIIEHIKLNIRRYELSQKAYSGLRTLLLGIFKQAKMERLTTISISTFFRDLQLSKNIFKKVKKKDTENVFSNDEAVILDGYFSDNPSMQNLGLQLMFLTGMRVGEMVALRWDHITAEGILVDSTEIYYTDKDTGKRVTTVRNTPKQGADDRMVSIPGKARIILRQIRKMNPFGEYVFMKDGKRIRSTSFNQHLYRACEKVGILPRSTHKIRKNYASKLVDANVEKSIIQSQMGHTNINTTMEYYYRPTLSREYTDQQVERAITG